MDNCCEKCTAGDGGMYSGDLDCKDCPCHKAKEECGHMILTPSPNHLGGMWCASLKPCKIHDKKGLGDWEDKFDKNFSLAIKYKEGGIEIIDFDYSLEELKDIKEFVRQNRQDLLKHLSQEIDYLAADEINQCRSDGFPTSRLTSLLVNIHKLINTIK